MRVILLMYEAPDGKYSKAVGDMEMGHRNLFGNSSNNSKLLVKPPFGIFSAYFFGGRLLEAIKNGYKLYT